MANPGYVKKLTESDSSNNLRNSVTTSRSNLLSKSSTLSKSWSSHQMRTKKRNNRMISTISMRKRNSMMETKRTMGKIL